MFEAKTMGGCGYDGKESAEVVQQLGAPPAGEPMAQRLHYWRPPGLKQGGCASRRPKYLQGELRQTEHKFATLAARPGVQDPLWTSARVTPSDRRRLWNFTTTQEVNGG
ncbi:MAG TPA: hypothetical protein VKZ53_15615 [Candidatus Angelobacter sp.]|nr:hypothetical protein [Candidatus Angelobacter sp.]